MAIHLQSCGGYTELCDDNFRQSGDSNMYEYGRVYLEDEWPRV